MLDQTDGHARSSEHGAYLDWCRARKERYPAALPEYFERQSPLNPYAFGDILWGEFGETDTIVAANATACIVTFQTARLKAGQRLFSNSGSASMGYDLPAAIGACLSGGAGRRTICMAGDGSIMMNLQELQTIATHHLPIKIFLLNNSGYSSILQSQTSWFPDNIAGTGPTSGVGFPDFLKVAAAFGIEAHRIERLDDAARVIRATLDSPGPCLCKVMLDPDQTFAPKLASRRLDDGRMVSSPLEDMAPFLSREELRDNMIIDVIDG